MKIGVARVSTEDQNLDSQIDDLRAEGILDENIYVDKISGKLTSLPQLDAALRAARPGDTMYFPRLDRMARTRRLIYKVADDLEDRGIDLVILHPRLIDTRSPGSRIVFAVLAAVAEDEGLVISARTKEGLAARKKRGLPVGRKPAMTDTQIAAAIEFYVNGKLPTWDGKGKSPTWVEVAKEFGVPVRTLHSSVRRYDLKYGFALPGSDSKKSEADYPPPDNPDVVADALGGQQHLPDPKGGPVWGTPSERQEQAS